ncbi:MAG: class I SAM-dependent methyltransferase [Thermoplasmata archaeon]
MKPERKAWEKFYSKQLNPWRGKKEILDFLKFVERGSLILDAGSGTGKSSLVYSNDFQIIMLDFSMNSLKNSNVKGEKVLGDVRKIPFKDNSFDAIIAVHILEHMFLNDRIKATDELFRVLKHGGYIFVESFSVEDFRFGKGKEIEKNTFLRGNRIFTHYFQENEFLKLLNKFEIIKIQKEIIKRKILNNTYKVINHVAIGIKE